MTAPNSPPTEFVLHTAGPMIHGVQRCRLCRAVLTDESRLAVKPGTTRFLRGGRVLVLTGTDYAITGPLPQDARLPDGTRACTPLPIKRKDS